MAEAQGLGGSSPLRDFILDNYFGAFIVVITTAVAPGTVVAGEVVDSADNIIVLKAFGFNQIVNVDEIVWFF